MWKMHSFFVSNEHAVLKALVLVRALEDSSHLGTPRPIFVLEYVPFYTDYDLATRHNLLFGLAKILVLIRKLTVSASVKLLKANTVCPVLMSAASTSMVKSLL